MTGFACVQVLQNWHNIRSQQLLTEMQAEKCLEYYFPDFNGDVDTIKKQNR